MKQVLKRIAAGLLQEIGKHFWLILSLGALLAGNPILALTWLVAAFYFKIADIYDTLNRAANISVTVSTTTEALPSAATLNGMGEEHF